MGAEPRDREQNSRKYRDQGAGPGSARIEDMAEAEEELHDDRRRDWADGFDQTAKGVAAKCYLLRKRGDGESDEVEKKQSEGTRLRPELDVQCPRGSHGDDGKHDKSPAQRSAKLPLPHCGNTLRKTKDLAKRGAPFGDGLQQRESLGQKKHQEGRGKQWARGIKPEPRGEAASCVPGDRLRGEEPGDGGCEECKLQGALGTALGCVIKRVQQWLLQEDS